MQSWTVCLMQQGKRKVGGIAEFGRFRYFQQKSSRPAFIKIEIPLNFWKLLVIFWRTIIAIPLIVLFANMIGL